MCREGYFSEKKHYFKQTLQTSILFQTPGHLCLLEEEENAEPQQGDEFPGDVRAPLLFFALSVGFEQTQQVCLTYTMQPSFIRTPPARHHKSPPEKKTKKRKKTTS